MVNDYSDRERGNLLPPHGLLFPISSKGNTDRITHTTMKDRSDDPSLHELMLLPRSYILLLKNVSENNSKSL